MPFALSRVSTEAKNASDVNTSVSAHPEPIKINPVLSNENIKTGIPMPIMNAVSMERATPANSPKIIVVRLNGWATSNSINSSEL